MSAGEWDERYAARDASLWTGRVNGTLAAEMSGARPGRALDVCCGEGGDALWLARQGWQVTAVDISAVALQRAAAGAGSAGLEVRWVCADFGALPSADEQYDLVSAQYPALKHSEGGETIRALLDAVAPGGTLLVVGHAHLDQAEAEPSRFDHKDYVQPGDVRAALDETWAVEVDEVRPRPEPVPDSSRFTHDVVLRARRSG